MGRLDPLKRIDLIIQAFLQMPDKQLIVASGGPHLHYLRQLAHQAKNIRFVGWTTEEQWHQLIGQAIATLYIPKSEDFGMSVVESMAAGKPVIGVAEGGLLETILPGKTGILLDPPPNIAAICQAVNTLTPDKALTMRRACQQQAQQFSLTRFITAIRQYL